MAWKRKADPNVPAAPAPKDPARCYNCGHTATHDPEVGCLEPGGTKYLEGDDGGSMHACSCEAFAPVPPEILDVERKAAEEYATRSQAQR